MTDLRVLVVADDPLSRAGLAALLQAEDDITVIGQISPTSTVLDAFTHDIALFDLGWELDDDLYPLAESALLDADTPLVVLVPDDTYVNEIAATLNGDTRTAPYSLLMRNAVPTQLTAALNATMEGLVTLDAGIASSLTPAPRTTPLLDNSYEPLTPREHEVLNLLAEGLPNKTIASRLHISEYTVKFHVNSILTKLGAGSRTEAVVRATRLGLITL